MATQRLGTGRSSEFTEKVILDFGRNSAVPGGGSLQLYANDEVLIGKRMNRRGTIKGGSIQVNVPPGAARAYKMSIRVNGVEVASIPLPGGTTGNISTSLSAPYVPGDLITVFVVRTAGAGASSFTFEGTFVECAE